METRTQNTIKFVIVPLIFCLILTGIAYSKMQPDFLLHVNFYDVGQGDAIFIQTFEGNQILIDGGPSNAILAKLGEDMPFFDRTIEMIILTHAHADHTAGLVDVLNRYKVKLVILPEVEFDSEVYKEFLQLISDKQIQKTYAKTGQRIYLDRATVFDVYYPSGKILGANFKDGFTTTSHELNDTSIVGKLTFGKTKILLTGDAGINIENMLLPEFDLDADILKVGHHGSKHSTSDEFLTEVTPAYSVIQVGKNNYGHPTEEVLDNLSQVQSQILRNDIDGTIRFVSDGVSLDKK